MISKNVFWDFPGGPWLRLLAFTAGGTGVGPGRELRSHLPHGQKNKKKKKKINKIKMFFPSKTQSTK